MLKLLVTALLACAPARNSPQPVLAQVVRVGPPQNAQNFEIPLPRTIVVEGPSPPMPDMRRPEDPEDQFAQDIEFSITLSLCAGHIPPGWLDAFYSWMVAVCKAGIASTERGKREQHLHIQACVRMSVRGPVDSKLCDKMKRDVKKACGITHGSGFRTRMECKPFGPGQTWGMMCGYCTKDFGKPHYRCVRHNVSQAEIDAGVRDWQSAKLSYDENKTVLTKKNLFEQLYSYKANQPPDSAHTSFIEVLTDMLNTGQYVFSPLAIMGYGVTMRAAAADALWALVHGRRVTMDAVAACVFSDYNYSSGRTGYAAPHERFYSADHRPPAGSRAPSPSPSTPPDSPGAPAPAPPPSGRLAQPSGRLAAVLATARARARVEDLGDYVTIDTAGAAGPSSAPPMSADKAAVAEDADKAAVAEDELSRVVHASLEAGHADAVARNASGIAGVARSTALGKQPVAFQPADRPTASAHRKRRAVVSDDDDDDDDDDDAAPLTAGGGAPARLPRYGNKQVSAARRRNQEGTAVRTARVTYLHRADIVAAASPPCSRRGRCVRRRGRRGGRRRLQPL